MARPHGDEAARGDEGGEDAVGAIDGDGAGVEVVDELVACEGVV